MNDCVICNLCYNTLEKLGKKPKQAFMRLCFLSTTNRTILFRTPDVASIRYLEINGFVITKEDFNYKNKILTKLKGVEFGEEIDFFDPLNCQNGKHKNM